MFVLSRAPCITGVNRWSPLLIRRSGSFVTTLTGAPSSIPDLEASAVLDQAWVGELPGGLGPASPPGAFPPAGHLRLRPPGRRHRRRGRRRSPGPLDWLEAELPPAAAGSATHPLLEQLTPTLPELDLPLDPFRALIEANRRTRGLPRYDPGTTWRLLQLSANPVGRLVLAVFGVAPPSGSPCPTSVHRPAAGRAPPRRRRGRPPRAGLPSRPRTGSRSAVPRPTCWLRTPVPPLAAVVAVRRCRATAAAGRRTGAPAGLRGLAAPGRRRFVGRRAGHRSTPSGRADYDVLARAGRAPPARTSWRAGHPLSLVGRPRR